MRACVFQFDVRRGTGVDNLERVETALHEAHGAGARLVVLPEMWPTSFPDAGDDLEALLAGTRRALERVRELSAELDLVVVGSGFASDPGGSGSERPPNRLHILEAGRQVAHYDKVHLFSPTAESEVFAAGAEPPPTVRTAAGLVSGVICYDLRFPEITRRPWSAGAQVLCVPAQWPQARAQHFRALCIGLAVSGQCFVVAANRVGRESVGRRQLVLEFPGNSIVVDPHGQVLAEGAGEEGLLAAELDLELVRELRKRVPVRRDLREELYHSWDQRP